MKELVEFIGSLNTEEKRAIRYFLNNMSADEKKGNNTLKVFNRITKGNFHRLTKKGKRKEDGALRKVKSRIIQAVLEALSSDRHIQHMVNSGDPDWISIKLRKEMVQFRILYHRRPKTNPAILLKLLDPIISSAKEYELFDLAAEALSFKRSIRATRSGSLIYEKLENQINAYRKWHVYIQEANDAYVKLIADAEFISRLTEAQRTQRYQDVITELQSFYDQSRSFRIGYHLKRIELAHYQHINDLETANDCCLDLISMLRKSKAIARPERLGIAYDYISRNDLLMKEYNRAIKTSLLAQKQYSNSGLNRLLSQELEFKARFLNGDRIGAERLLKKMKKSRLEDSKGLREQKFEYYTACVEFQDGNYTKALKSLQNTSELAKDKGRWDISVRILRVLSLKKKKKYDLATDHIEALRRCLQRPNSLKRAEERDKLIYNCLFQIEKSAYNFNSENSRIRALYLKLSSSEDSYKWSPNSIELIPFHTWLLEHYPILAKTPATPAVHANGWF